MEKEIFRKDDDYNNDKEFKIAVQKEFDEIKIQ